MNSKDNFFNQSGYIYLAYRLFNFIDKLDALALDRELVMGIQVNYGTTLQNYPVFLPYRDTLQHSEVGAFTWESVYVQDVAQLDKAYATVALMNGPSFDDGVSFELGYSVGSGLPTVVVVNDALVYHEVKLPKTAYLIDPVIDSYVGKIVSSIHLHGRIFGDGLLGGLDVNVEFGNPAKRFKFTQTLTTRFSKRLESLTQDAYLKMGQMVKELINKPEKFTKKLTQKRHQQSQVHLEFGGGKYQWQQELGERLTSDMNGSGLNVSCSSRFVQKGSVNQDVDALLAAEVVVVCGDGDNVDVGTAFLMGMAKAKGKKIVLYFSGKLIWSEPPVLPPIARNPMITYSADKVVTDYDQIESELRKLL